MIVLADELPVLCASCFEQKPGMPHVDFDAAVDRGYGERDDGQQVSMDELVLCAECVRAAAELVGYGDLGEAGERITELQAEVKRAQDNERAAVHYADGIEQAVGRRPVPINAKGGRPRKRHESLAAA